MRAATHPRDRCPLCEQKTILERLVEIDRTEKN